MFYAPNSKSLASRFIIFHLFIVSYASFPIPCILVLEDFFGSSGSIYGALALNIVNFFATFITIFSIERCEWIKSYIRIDTSNYLTFGHTPQLAVFGYCLLEELSCVWRSFLPPFLPRSRMQHKQWVSMNCVLSFVHLATTLANVIFTM